MYLYGPAIHQELITLQALHISDKKLDNIQFSRSEFHVNKYKQKLNTSTQR